VSLIWDDELITYRQMVKQAANVAGGLKSLGFMPGDRIAFWLPNVPAYVILLIASARLGVTAVAVNTRFGAGEVEDIAGRAGAKALALWPGFDGIADDILARIDPLALPKLEMLIEMGGGAVAATGWENAPCIRFEALLDDPPMDASLAGPDMDCATFTTSGTTSAPKIVVQAHGSLARHALDVAAGFGFGSETVSLQALPLCGVFGFAQAMAVLASGGRLVMLAKFDGAQAAGLIRQWSVDSFAASDDMIQRILDAGPEPFPSLKFIGYAAFNSALDDIVERAQARGVTLRGLYGMSECMALYSVRPIDAAVSERKKGGGTPVSPDARVRVTDPETGAVLPMGEAGALEVAGPSLFARYDGNPDATEAAFTEDGFFRTGDLARLEPDGSFEFLGRMGDVLRLGGFLVNPAEIEEHLQTHPSVHAAQVVAVGTAQGMRAVAFVVVSEGQALDHAALIVHCQTLARYKQPMRFATLESFPVIESANGIKIRRTELRELAKALIENSQYSQ